MKILTPNCHEAWIHQLGSLEIELDIIVGLSGRYTSVWDERMRPVPENARLVSLEQVQNESAQYGCIIAHNITDLLDLKFIRAPKILVLHGTLEGRLANEKSNINLQDFRNQVRVYTQLIGAHVVAVSKLKAKSWGIDCEVVQNGVEVSEYLDYDGSLNTGLRISNQINARREILMWDFHQQAFGDLKVDLVGHNPDMPGVEPAKNWQDLKQTMSRHRFYIHTADLVLEDGFNLAMLEAMASGLPVLGNRHPSSIVIHGESGYLSDDPQELRNYALKLMENRELARQMGQKARQCVKASFSLPAFTKNMAGAIARAGQIYNQHHKA